MISRYRGRRAWPLFSHADFDVASVDYGRSQRSGRRTRSWSRRSKLLLGVVVIMILVDFFTALFLGTRTYSLDRQNEILRSDLAKSQEELHRTMPELQKLRRELDELIRGKLPSLRKLEYDQVLTLDEGYLKNITFTKVVNRSVQSYEYKLVVQNNTRATLWPEIQIRLFNDLGIEVGNTEIGTVDPNALKAASLGIGEVRSYSSILPLSDKSALPTYFMIKAIGQQNVPVVTGSEPAVGTGANEVR